jgi:hypothetical protein
LILSQGSSESPTGAELFELKGLDFDLAIGMFGGAGGVDAFNNTHITGNYIRMARDVASAGDTAQNIAIYYSFGTNQVISGNTITIQFHVPVPPLVWDDRLPQMDVRSLRFGRSCRERRRRSRPALPAPPKPPASSSACRHWRY